MDRKKDLGDERLNILNRSIFLLPTALLFFLIIAHNGEAKEAIKNLSNSIVERNAGCYKVSKSYLLTKSVHGIDGELQLLQDSRLTEEAYDKQFGTAFTTMHIYDDNTLAKFKDSPPLGTILRILSRHKEYVLLSESNTYDHAPVAMLEEVRLSNDDKPTYLFTLDKSIGMGSYNGPTTCFYEINDGKLKKVEYIDNTTKKREQIALMRSLKTDWKFVNSKDGKSKDILHIACRPNFGNQINSSEEEGDDFLVYYDRFQFNGKEWVKYTRVEKGFWEAEPDDADEFLPLSKFPVGN